MDYLQLLRALLAGVYKMPDGEITALLEADGQTIEAAQSAILLKDKERIDRLSKGKTGNTFQDGYKKAKAEVLAAHEAEIREKYDIEDEELTGLELVGAVIAKEAPEAGKATLTEETIKKHPVFLKYEKDKKKELDKVAADWAKKLEDVQKQVGKTEVFGKVSTKALELLDGLNPVLPGTPKVAQTQRTKWLEELRGYNYQVNEDGEFEVLDKDGKPLDDGHGNPIKFEDLVKNSAADWFEFKSNNGGGNAGNEGSGGKGNGGGAGKYPAGIAKPKNIEELSKITNDPKIKLEDRQAVMAAWQTENPG